MCNTALCGSFIPDIYSLFLSEISGCVCVPTCTYYT